MPDDDTTQSPTVYTELINAQIMSESKSKLAWVCMFGDRIIALPKSCTQIKDSDRVFVERSFAKKKQSEWRGAFVKGSQFTRMHAIDKALQDTIEAVANTLINCGEMLKDALTKLG